MELKLSESIKPEHLKKLEPNIVEARIPITREEVITINLEVLANEIIAAKEAVERRESELASARKYFDSLTTLEKNAKKAK